MTISAPCSSPNLPGPGRVARTTHAHPAATPVADSRVGLVIGMPLRAVRLQAVEHLPRHSRKLRLDVVSTLADHVRDVFPLRPKKEMGRVHAARVVTLVTDALGAIRKAPSVNRVRNSVRENYPLESRHVELSVPVAVRSAEPLPALGLRANRNPGAENLRVINGDRHGH